MPLGFYRAQLELPTLGDCSAHTFGQVMVAGKDIVQTFFVQHFHGLDQSIHQWQSGGVGKVAGVIALQHVLQVKVGALELSCFVFF